MKKPTKTAPKKKSTIKAAKGSEYALSIARRQAEEARGEKTVDQRKAIDDFLADVPPAKAPDLRQPLKRDALEDGYYALEEARIDHAKALRELSGDMGRLAHLIAQYLPSERCEDFKREAADILNRKQEQS